MPNQNIVTSDNLSQLPLNRLIDELQRELKKLQAMQSVTKPSEAVVEILEAKPGAARRDIVKATRLNPKKVSNVLDELQRNGLAIHLGDRRGSRWFLTATLESLTKP